MTHPEEEVFEIYLPQNKITEEFAGKSNSEKTQILELGISLFKRGHDMLQYWNNDDWKQQIANLEERLERETSSLRDENKKTGDRVKQQQEDKFNIKIQSLENYIKDLENRNRDMLLL